MWTVQKVIENFESKFPHNDYEAKAPVSSLEVDAYVSARMLRMIEHVEKNNVSFVDLKEYLSDDIAHWIGG